MNEKEASAWYQPGLPDKAEETRDTWYAPASGPQKQEPAEDVHEGEGTAYRKKNGKLKRAMIIVLIVLVAVAVCLAVLPFPENVTVKVTADAPADFEEEEDSSGQSPYIYSTEGGTTSIARYAAEDGFNLKLVSSAGKEELTWGEIYESCRDSIVIINAWEDGSAWLSWGTGIVMSEDGYIVTNDHIIQGMGRATVELMDGTTYDALLVGEDEDADLAVLKIDAEGLKSAEFGLSTELRVGDRVCAIGNPLSRSLTATLTGGIVSALDRTITMSGTTMTLIQTDTALNEGNSGGPLFNMYGQVVGITNMKLMTTSEDLPVEGIGFAIPSATVEVVADRLIASSGATGKPGIGIVGSALTQSQCLKHGVDGGVLVVSVTEGTDASGKLKVGDIVTAVNGTPVTSVEDINAVKADLQIGDSLEITFVRDGEEETVEIVLVDMTLVG